MSILASQTSAMHTVSRAAAPQSVVVVGAGAAGLGVSEQLRRTGYAGTITIIGEEPGEPCDRPPLSKQVLAGTWEPQRASLLPERRRDAIAANWAMGQRALGVDLINRLVETDHQTYPYDSLVIATGVRPRTLPWHDLMGIHVLRTVSDSLALRSSLRSGVRFVVIGAGFLGLECAATAAAMGARVTVVEPLETPLASRIGSLAARRLLDLHETHDVHLLLGSQVEEFVGGDTEPPQPYLGSSGEPGRPQRVAGVRLADGQLVDADVVLVAVGAVPCVEWLDDSGLLIDDGVVCDEFCAAAPNVWAAGDVARWLHLGLGRHVRLEHRMNANEQAQAVAGNILGAAIPFSPIPFFWTDQFDLKIQVWGTVPVDARQTVAEGDPGGDSFVVTFRDAQTGRLEGALGWNASRQLGDYRDELLTGGAPAKHL